MNIRIRFYIDDKIKFENEYYNIEFPIKLRGLSN